MLRTLLLGVLCGIVALTAYGVMLPAAGANEIVRVNAPMDHGQTLQLLGKGRHRNQSYPQTAWWCTTSPWSGCYVPNSFGLGTGCTCCFVNGCFGGVITG